MSTQGAPLGQSGKAAIYLKGSYVVRHGPSNAPVQRRAGRAARGPSAPEPVVRPQACSQQPRVSRSTIETIVKIVDELQRRRS